ncbi:hypothetical protein DL93DRAFT_2076683 [Clavulina sp. PMI_390]|nr:hypothetical protein DL93DRAFT_2076683 [Clavulina sp. PMI_390]
MSKPSPPNESPTTNVSTPRRTRELETRAPSELDASMTHSSGSVVFSVQGVKFKIPKALLQQHSDAFNGMLAMADSGDEAVVLDDSLEGFRQFRAVLFTPFDSCLASTETDSIDTINPLLELLLIANKYCMEKIEKLALNKLLSLVVPESLAYFPLELRLRTLEVAALVHSPELARAPRANLLNVLWCQDAPSEVSVELLQLGKRIGDQELASAGYYAVMRSGRSWWSTNDKLDEEDKQRLVDGMFACAEVWQRIHTGWGAFGFGCHTECPRKREVLDASLRIQHYASVEWYDVLGKISATVQANVGVRGSPHCAVAIADRLADVNDEVKRDIGTYFLGTFGGGQ